MKTRTLAWTNAAWSDYLYWQGQDKRMLRRINRLIADVMRSPFEGIGRARGLEGELERPLVETHRPHSPLGAFGGRCPSVHRRLPLSLRRLTAVASTGLPGSHRGQDASDRAKRRSFEQPG